MVFIITSNYKNIYLLDTIFLVFHYDIIKNYFLVIFILF